MNKIILTTDLKIPPCRHSSQKLSNLLDIILKHLCELSPSFVRNDMDYFTLFLKV